MIPKSMPIEVWRALLMTGKAEVSQYLPPQSQHTTCEIEVWEKGRRFFRHGEDSPRYIEHTVYRVVHRDEKGWVNDIHELGIPEEYKDGSKVLKGRLWNWATV